jgi:hypothetical protein
MPRIRCKRIFRLFSGLESTWILKLKGHLTTFSKIRPSQPRTLLDQAFLGDVSFSISGITIFLDPRVEPVCIDKEKGFTH